ncbi:MAG: AarF/UbiB family protein, partial [archaeon]
MGNAEDASLEEIKKKSVALREQIISMGATFVKMGQVLSMRYDFLHAETCRELQKLLDEQAQVLSYEQVLEHLYNEFGQAAEQLHNVSQEPLAVASLAQVHTAYLAGTNQKLAVKIQKPFVREQLENDINSINHFMFLLKILPKKYRYTLEDVLNEFAEFTLKELDFTLEAANIERFNNLFQNNHSVVPLLVFRKFSNNKILTTGFVEG